MDGFWLFVLIFFGLPALYGIVSELLEIREIKAETKKLNAAATGVEVSKSNWSGIFWKLVYIGWLVIFVLTFDEWTTSQSVVGIGILVLPLIYVAWQTWADRQSDK